MAANHSQFEHLIIILFVLFIEKEEDTERARKLAGKLGISLSFRYHSLTQNVRSRYHKQI